MSLMKNDLRSTKTSTMTFFMAFLLCAGQHLCRMSEESGMDGITLSSN